jgi:hypothetical protein
MGALPEYGCCRVVAMVVGSLVADFTQRANFASLKIFKRLRHSSEIGLAVATREMTIGGIGSLSGMLASRRSSLPMVTLQICDTSSNCRGLKPSNCPLLLLTSLFS